MRYFGSHVLWAAILLLLNLGYNPPPKTHFYQYPETNTDRDLAIPEKAWMDRYMLQMK